MAVRAAPEPLADVLTRLEGLGDMQGSEVVRLAPLFADEGELAEFRERHDAERVRRGSLADYRGVAFLGIDAGSTTFKAALIGEDGETESTQFSARVSGGRLEVTLTAQCLEEIGEERPGTEQAPEG